VQIYKIYSNVGKKKDKNLRFYGFLGCSNTLLAIIVLRNRGKDTGKQGERGHLMRPYLVVLVFILGP
jgi:hypothetical protein